ncbi:phosphomannomutase [Salana multivorans]|uniref:Phosphomannomutase n=1 Tax=Salana multivorans TaxID=120377 RepID=A0A3N2D830_9MICO|nr:phospho-sugar mutase [Salana multivorans]ROR95931.1 phosphomannomutase [Salana multivorans]
MNHTDLVARARDWAAHDPDPRTRAELLALVALAETGDTAGDADDATSAIGGERSAQDALAELASRFSGPLQFGTAGLRGAVAAGESRMNVAVVVRATAGLARYLLDTVGPGARVVIGCDARHGSSEFMDAAAEVLAASGAEVRTLPKRLPTPVTAYAVRALDCDAGVMITASHNPPADNGYKVYLGGRLTDEDGRGVQIVPPADADIAARIAAAPPADEVPRSREGIVPTGDGVVRDYVARAGSLRGRGEDAAADSGDSGDFGGSGVRIVLTPMHGVGGETAERALHEAGFPDVHLVPKQADPDPNFPTVSFPNPEEPGAIDLSIELAEELDATVVVALDPDADRCSVAIPLRDGGWRQLTGDEIGAILGEQAAADPARSGGTLACSVVSSRLLGRIAAGHGLRSAATLTGFKWIARTPDIRFGYEEAIGYCTDPEAVHDKDGVTAAVRVATLADDLAAQGRTIEDLLDDLARRHGLYATAQLSFRVADVSLIADGMARLRANGIDSLAGSPVVETRDLAQGSADLPPTDGLMYVTAADDRVIARPSGTEPKLKCYLEVVLPVGDDGVIPRAAAAERLTRIKADMTAALGF